VKDFEEKKMKWCVVGWVWLMS